MRGNMWRFKGWVAQVARRMGYKIERLTDEDINPLDVFELLIDRLHALKGEEFYFVQIGANDGKTDDPIREYIEKYHLKGLLV